MRRKSVIIITCLLFNLGYAVDSDYYLLGNIGGGRAFSIALQDQLTLPLSNKILGGISLQWPCRWKTSFAITGLYHGWVATPAKCAPIKSLYPTGSLEAVIKKPVFQVNTRDSIQLQCYAKGGGWAMFTPAIVNEDDKEELSLLAGGGLLIGGGVQIQRELSCWLLDISLNGLISALNVNHNGYLRIGIGRRL